MKRERNITEIVKRRLEKLGAGATVSYRNFSDLPFGVVAKVLSRLVTDGTLVRVRKGIYHLPKKTALGSTSPKFEDVLEETSWSQPLFNMGAGATLTAYNLGMTTQIPAETILVGDYTNRTVELGGRRVRTRRRKVKHLKNLSPEEFYILETLRYIKSVPGASPEDVITTVKKRLKGANVSELIRAALKEPPRVRALLGALLQDIIGKRADVIALKKSLNPLTIYKLGVSEYLKSADEWKIK